MKFNVYLKYLTLFFMFLFPLSGMYFFHHKITNLIIVIIILLLLIGLLFTNKEALKKSKYLFFYYFICGIYLMMSYFHSKSFISFIPNEYSLLNESLIVLKLIMPITFIFVLYYQNILKKEYLFIIKSWIIIIAGLIVFTNILEISLSSYNNKIILHNIFEWDKHIYYIYTASKGFFTYANQVAVILLILLISTIYLVLFNRKRNIFYVILIAIAMLMLGTRVSSLGGLITLICMLIFYLIHCLVSKNKINKNIYLFLIPIGLWFILLPISPFANRDIELKHQEILTTINTEVQEKQLVVSKEKTNKKEYVLNNYNPNYLPSFFFLDYYPIDYDEDFWYEFVKNTSIEETNYRVIEKSIINRIIDINDNKLDILLGISNDRIQNVVNLERDILLHYYAFGIIGSIILLFNYIFMFGFLVRKIILDKTYYNYLKLSCLLLFLFSAFLTGNILNSLFPTIILSFILMMNYKEDSNSEKKSPTS